MQRIRRSDNHRAPTRPEFLWAGNADVAITNPLFRKPRVGEAARRAARSICRVDLSREEPRFFLLSLECSFPLMRELEVEVIVEASASAVPRLYPR